MNRRRAGPCLATLMSIGVVLNGCATPEQNVALGVGVAAVIGGNAPTNEIEQIYYLGIFDPHEQVPQAVYRVRVRGQASFLSRTRFASGWVPAAVVDSLGGKIALDVQTGDITEKSAEPAPSLTSRRRMIVFGPEGFREAPRDHRLVLVMGSSPEEFFQGIDNALGTLSRVRVERLSADFQQAVLRSLAETGALRAAVAELERDLALDGGSR